MTVYDCPSDVLTKVSTDENYAEMSLAEVRLFGGTLGVMKPHHITQVRFTKYFG